MKEESPPEKEKLIAFSATFSQDNDSCDPSDLDQHLYISVEDGGGGPYVTIRTERWALDPKDIEPFAKKLLNLVNKIEP